MTDDEADPMTTDSTTMRGSRSVSKYAVAGGTTNIATTRIEPTASKAVTVTTAVITISR